MIQFQAKAMLKGKCHEFWVFFFIGLMCLHDHNNDVYSLVFLKKNYSLRYELSKMAIFCFLPCYFLPVGVAKRDVIGGLMQINPFLYRGK